MLNRLPNSTIARKQAEKIAEEAVKEVADEFEPIDANIMRAINRGFDNYMKKQGDKRK